MSNQHGEAAETVGSDLISHLTELRKRLIYVAGWFLASLGVGLYAAPKILTFVKGHLGAIEVEWSVFALSDGIAVYMKCALLVGIILTLPFLMYHLWAFARPGMTDAEAKSTLVYVPTSSLLFVGGVLFGYTVALPMMIRFMIKLNQSMGAQEVYGIQHYMSFLISFLLPMGVAFEMPLAMTFLTRIGMLTPGKMKQVRKFAYVGLAVVGTLISPPDFVSHLSVTVPLILLFEISAFISARYYRRKFAVQTT
ncbi:twin-arginine translocase subunit TatC [Paenibacillus sp. BK033]|uniref:twin-arginine translocase subunit TatC n=1 Tax=unclassified Paenibacillus TaxID=185978 RepID=UPI001046E2C7|nr:twin-arginine translocase subunit TatC [Paenibacillus sp. BK033]NIK71658.1 sec-independent protein translocase protein TatC [Paenibacillus sp. BK720]TCM96307.1 sec-independent protein translocase protein TatC [Paenibacillus sp. BK033]